MLLVFLMIASAGAAPGTSILPQVQQGRLLCSNPDAVRKTCSSLSAFAKADSGGFRETTELLIPSDDPISLEMSAKVQIDGSRFCGSITQAELDKGIVRVGGERLPPEQNSLVMSKLAERLKSMVGRRTCDELRMENARLMKFGEVEGVDAALQGKPVSWVSRSEGYRVAP